MIEAKLWFALIAIMFAVYVALDGFDFGAGILHLFVAKTDEERRSVLAAIGPVWDGNEVWLIAGGGTLVFAFPRVYAAGFSGFYLPLMMALWLLILRGISIEFRSHEAHPLWRSFWDGVFFLSSSLMAVILGAALGNVIRGVPINSSGYFSGPLFTNFVPGRNPGVLDWYTVTVGLFALFALALHGAFYLNLKTEGAVQERSRAIAKKLCSAVLLLGILVTIATNYVQPALYTHLIDRPWTWILALIIVAGMFMMPAGCRKKNDMLSFLGSTALLIGMLAATAAGEFPVLLTSTISPEYNLTVTNASTGAHGLTVGLIWWIPAAIIAGFYFFYLFRLYRGKVSSDIKSLSSY